MPWPRSPLDDGGGPLRGDGSWARHGRQIAESTPALWRSVAFIWCGIVLPVAALLGVVVLLLPALAPWLVSVAVGGTVAAIARSLLAGQHREQPAAELGYDLIAELEARRAAGEPAAYIDLASSSVVEPPRSSKL